MAPTGKDILLKARVISKTSLGLTRSSVQREINAFRQTSLGSKPWELEERLKEWEDAFERFRFAEEEYTMHPEVTSTEYNAETVQTETSAYRKACAAVREFNHAADAEGAAQAADSPPPAQEGAQNSEKTDARRPPLLERDENLQTFTDWLRVWNTYADVINLAAKPRQQQVNKL